MGQPFYRSFRWKGIFSIFRGQAFAVALAGRRKAVPLPRIIEKIPCHLLIHNLDGNANPRLLAPDSEHGQPKDGDGVGDAGGVP